MAQQPQEEPPDLSALIHALRRHDESEPVCQQQPVFARVAGQWRCGVVVQTGGVHGPQQQLQVQVAGCAEQLSRQDVRVPVPCPDDDAPVLPQLPGQADSRVDALVASLRADDPSHSLEEDETVFAKFGRNWGPGVVVARTVTKPPLYSVLIGQTVHDMPRAALCASAVPGETDGGTAVPQELADSRLLQRSLKQNDPSHVISQDEPVFVSRSGGWQPGVVLRRRQADEGAVLYTVLVGGSPAAVLDVTREEVCPQAPPQAPSAQKGGGIFSHFLQKRRRQRTPDGTGSADVAQAAPQPSAQAALRGPVGVQDKAMGGAQNEAEQHLPARPSDGAGSTQAAALSLEGDKDDAHGSRAVAEGLLAEGCRSNGSSAGSEWSSESPREHERTQQADVLQPEHKPWHSHPSPRRCREQLCQVSASLKGLLLAQQQQSTRGLRSEPIGESAEQHDASIESSPQDWPFPNDQPDGGHGWQPDMEKLRDALANQDNLDGATIQQSSFAVCVTVHNGIQSVGEEVWFPRATVWAPAESDAVTVLCPDAVSIDWVPEDVCCTIVVELRLLGTPVARITAEPHVQQLLKQSERIAWAVIPPFADISAAAVSLNQASQLLPMQHGPGLDPRGACVCSCQEIIASECMRLGMLSRESAVLLEALGNRADAQPLMQVMLTMQEGSNPRPPTPQIPLASQSYDTEGDMTGPVLEPEPISVVRPRSCSPAWLVVGVKYIGSCVLCSRARECHRMLVRPWCVQSQNSPCCCNRCWQWPGSRSLCSSSHSRCRSSCNRCARNSPRWHLGSRTSARVQLTTRCLRAPHKRLQVLALHLKEQSGECRPTLVCSVSQVKIQHPGTRAWP